MHAEERESKRVCLTASGGGGDDDSGTNIGRREEAKSRKDDQLGGLDSMTTVVLRHLAADVTLAELMQDMEKYGALAFHPVLEPEGGVANVYFKNASAAHRAIADLDGRTGELSARKQRISACILTPP